MGKKRALGFTPDVREREVLSRILTDYITKYLKDYAPQIDVQTYSSFSEPPQGNQLGQEEARDLFVVVSADYRYKGFPGDRGRLAKLSFDASIDLLTKNRIPSIIVRGRITEKQASIEFGLIKLKERITDRMNEKVEPKEKPAPITYL